MFFPPLIHHLTLARYGFLTPKSACVSENLALSAVPSTLLSALDNVVISTERDDLPQNERRSVVSR